MPNTRPMPAPMAAIDSNALPAGTRWPTCTALKPGLVVSGFGDPTAVVCPARSKRMKVGSVYVKQISLKNFFASKELEAHKHIADTRNGLAYRRD